MERSSGPQSTAEAGSKKSTLEDKGKAAEAAIGKFFAMSTAPVVEKTKKVARMGLGAAVVGADYAINKPGEFIDKKASEYYNGYFEKMRAHRQVGLEAEPPKRLTSRWQLYKEMFFKGYEGKQRKLIGGTFAGENYFNELDKYRQRRKVKADGFFMNVYNRVNENVERVTGPQSAPSRQLSDSPSRVSVATEAAPAHVEVLSSSDKLERLAAELEAALEKVKALMAERDRLQHEVAESRGNKAALEELAARLKAA